MESTDTADTTEHATQSDLQELPEIESITANRGFIPESRAAWWPWKRKPKTATA